MKFLYAEFTKITTVFIMLTQWAVHWEDIIDRFSSVFGLKKIIERRNKHMNILEIPQFVKDVVQLANDVKAAQAVLAPQFPQLIADAERIKTDGEKLLGISAPPAA